MPAFYHRTVLGRQITDVWCHGSNEPESLTFDFLLRQEKHATLIGVPRRLAVTDGFMEGVPC
jgi:hypothetical protein